MENTKTFTIFRAYVDGEPVSLYVSKKGGLMCDFDENNGRDGEISIEEIKDVVYNAEFFNNCYIDRAGESFSDVEICKESETWTIEENEDGDLELADGRFDLVQMVAKDVIDYYTVAELKNLAPEEINIFLTK